MERLDDWYKSAKIDTPDLLTWLKAQTPDEWHQAAFMTTFDGDQRRLAWIIDQPSCELSTALCVFWQGDPGNILKEILLGNGELPPRSSLEIFVVLKRIADNLAAGFYRNRNIGFPTPPPPGGHDNWRGFIERFESYHANVRRVADAGKVMPWTLPDLAFERHAGRRFESDYAVEGGEAHLRYDLWCERNPE